MLPWPRVSESLCVSYSHSLCSEVRLLARDLFTWSNPHPFGRADSSSWFLYNHGWILFGKSCRSYCRNGEAETQGKETRETSCLCLRVRISSTGTHWLPLPLTRPLPNHPCFLPQSANCVPFKSFPFSQEMWEQEKCIALKDKGLVIHSPQFQLRSSRESSFFFFMFFYHCIFFIYCGN